MFFEKNLLYVDFIFNEESKVLSNRIITCDDNGWTSTKRILNKYRNHRYAERIILKSIKNLIVYQSIITFSFICY